MRRNPNRDVAYAISRMRARSSDWSRARPGRYDPARLNCAERQARTRLTPNVIWNHPASSRRRTGLRLFSDGLRQHMLLDREVRDQLLQPRIFLFQQPQAPEFAHP
jgi:hypothetical protein